MNQPTNITFYPNGLVSVRDQDGNDIPELQKTGWMEMYFERLEKLEIDPSKIKFQALVNGEWKQIAPVKLFNNDWSYEIITPL